MRLIGFRCKASNGFSQEVLIEWSFVPIKNVYKLLLIFIEAPNFLFAGVLSKCAPPVPIPNTEVKVLGSDGTCPNTAGRVGYAGI